ncbi:unnamed protein product [Urochloa humidicola]
MRRRTMTARPVLQHGWMVVVPQLSWASRDGGSSLEAQSKAHESSYHHSSRSIGPSPCLIRLFSWEVAVARLSLPAPPPAGSSPRPGCWATPRPLTPRPSISLPFSAEATTPSLPPLSSTGRHLLLPSAGHRLFLLQPGRARGAGASAATRGSRRCEVRQGSGGPAAPPCPGGHCFPLTRWCLRGPAAEIRTGAAAAAGSRRVGERLPTCRARGVVLLVRRGRRRPSLSDRPTRGRQGRRRAEVASVSGAGSGAPPRQRQRLPTFSFSLSLPAISFPLSLTGGEKRWPAGKFYRRCSKRPRRPR